MADVYAVFATLLALGISFPGMLATWWLLFPNIVHRAEIQIGKGPWRCFGIGLITALLIGIPITILFAIPLPFFKLLGAISLIMALGLAGIGTAGIALKMARQMQGGSIVGMSEVGAFVRAAVIMELAAAFPLVGWFLFIPSTIFVSLGAFVLARIQRIPQEAKQAIVAGMSSTPSEA